MKKYSLNSLSPVESYTPPALPSIEQANKPALLKPTPKRWKSRVGGILCAGLVLGSLLAGCSPFRNCCCMHGGGNGGGGGPMYVQHFTEQEALHIIRTNLKEIGLNFDFDVPQYRVEIEGAEYEIALYDKENSVAVVHLHSGWTESGWNDWHGNHELLEQIAYEFELLGVVCKVVVLITPATVEAWRTGATQSWFEEIIEEQIGQISHYLNPSQPPYQGEENHESDPTPDQQMQS